MRIIDFTHQGKRPYQEDAHAAWPEAGIFLVCDGVGGSSRGDLASRTVCQLVGSRLAQVVASPPAEGFSPAEIENHIQAAVQAAQAELTSLAAEDPALQGMATTLTLAWLVGGQWYLAHVGDSRIYFVGQGGYWRSRDHSLVQDLFDKGYLKTEAEMENHPQANRINRAIQAVDQSQYIRADINRLGASRSGEILLLCTDGVLEAWGNQSLVYQLARTDVDLAQRIEEIEKRCAALSRDNNTAICLELDSTAAPAVAATLPLLAIPASPEDEIELNDDDELPPDEVYEAAATNATLAGSRPAEVQIEDELESSATPARYLLLVVFCLLTLALLWWQPWRSAANGQLETPPATEQTDPSDDDTPQSSPAATTPPNRANRQERPPRGEAPPQEEPGDETGAVGGIFGGAAEALQEVGGSPSESTNDDDLPTNQTQDASGQDPDAEDPTSTDQDKPDEDSPTDGNLDTDIYGVTKPGGFNIILAQRRSDSYWVYLDRTTYKPLFAEGNKFVIAYPFKDGVACAQPVWANSKWLYIKPNGDRYINVLYDSAEPFTNGTASVSTDGRSYTIDMDGREVNE